MEMEQANTVDIFRDISEKYSYSLKSQNNPTKVGSRIFESRMQNWLFFISCLDFIKLLNKICTSELVNLLEHMQHALKNDNTDKYETIWNIIKFGLFSKYCQYGVENVDPHFSEIHFSLFFLF